MINREDIKYVKHGIQRKGSDTVPLERKPDWLKVKLPTGENYAKVKQTVRENRLSTVCEEAMCPNLGECWDAGTATIMLMGSVCTRACKFCAVSTGNPKGWLDLDEPRLAAESVKLMGLKYVVLTSVDRDDLPDGGAGHYAACVRKIKEVNPGTAVEALTPDFAGNLEHVHKVLESGVEVYAQNLETVERLTHPVRDPRAGYEQTLKVLESAKTFRPDVLTKTSLMLGLGETEARNLRNACRLARRRRGHRHLWAVPAPDGGAPEGRALRYAGRIRAIPNAGVGKRLFRGCFGAAGKEQLPGGAGLRKEQRRAVTVS